MQQQHSKYFDIHASLPLLRPRLGLALSLVGSVLFAGLVTAKNPSAFKIWVACQGLTVAALGVKFSQDLRNWEKPRIIQSEARLNLISEQAAIQATIFPQHQQQYSAEQPALISPSGEGGDRLNPEINWDDVLAAPHLAVVGKTGSGKSALTQWLSTELGGDIAVYDSDASPNEWQGLKVVGCGADYEAIAAAMQSDLEELQRRTELRAVGKNDFPPMVRILEESPETLSALKDSGHDVGYQWLKGILRRGRKYGVKLILLSQGFSVRSLRIEGEGELRDNIAVLRLGKVALQYAKDSTIKEALKAQQRPLLVEDETVGCVPDLSAFLNSQKGGDRQINLQKTPAPPMHPAPHLHQTRTTLEALYNKPCTDAPLAEMVGVQCPKCDSPNTRTNGTRGNKTRYRCKACGASWSE